MARQPQVCIRTIGRCIYCGSTEPPLSKEHSIPQGLDGYGYLKDASCEACRLITHAFETDVLRKMMWGIRRDLGVGGNHRDSGNPIFVPTRDHDGTIGGLELQNGDIPTKAVFPALAQPPGLYGGQPQPDLELRVLVDEQALERLEQSGVVGPVAEFRGPSFWPMLAKIAHCQAVSDLGLDAFEPFLTDFIRGVSPVDEWPKFIGAPPEARPPADNTTAYALVHQNDQGFLLGRIRILGMLGAPVYDVAIGRLRAAPA